MSSARITMFRVFFHYTVATGKWCVPITSGLLLFLLGPTRAGSIPEIIRYLTIPELCSILDTRYSILAFKVSFI